MEQNKEKESNKENKNNKRKKLILILTSVALLLIIIVVLIVILGIGCQNTKRHELVVHQRVESTCLTEGNEEYYSCKTCDLLFEDKEGTKEIKLEDTVIAKKPHTTIFIAAIPETDTTLGKSAYYECSECNGLFSDSEGKTSITIDQIELAETSHGLHHIAKVEPTCTTSGNIEYYECYKCNKKFSDSNGTNEVTNITLNALGHNLTLVPAIESTTTTNGHIAYYECSECNNIFTDSEGKNQTTLEAVSLPLHVHNMSYVAKVEPTCTIDGVKAHYTCSLCLKNYEDEAGNTELTSLVITKLGHEFETTLSHDQNVHFNKCSRCNERQNETFHNYFRGVCQDSDCAYSIIDNNDTTITVPNGVTSIGVMAFSGCSTITSISLPSTLTTIGRGAFYGTSITTIEIPSSVTSIESAAFMNCSKLKYVSFSNCNITVLNAQMFQNCPLLEYVVIPSSVIEINNRFFNSNTQEITIYYESSKTDWDNINKHEGDEQVELSNAKVCYYDETKVSDSTTTYWHYVNNVPTINR